MRVRRVARGERIIEHGEEAKTLFVVNFGLFEVLDDDGRVVNEIGTDELIGEIGFFAKAPRTAAVAAVRNSEVLAIDRAEFDALTARHPEIQSAITGALARRLVRFALRLPASPARRPHGPARVAVVLAAGAGRVDDRFFVRLRSATDALGGGRLVSREEAANAFPAADPDPHALAGWLSAVERANELVIAVADHGMTGWTNLALRSADQLLLVAQGEAADLSPAEKLAFELFPRDRRRLLCVEPRRSGVAASSVGWRRSREVFMTHHLALEDDEDFRSLARFLCGRAIGYVAGGGGAYGPAHVGVYKAFREAGVPFDIHGGSSVGAAMAAAFSLLKEPETIKEQIQEMFVTRAALKRFTFPRFSLLDHEVFDRELRQRYGVNGVEDMWRPYFAVAADLSTYTTRVIREGPVWQAIRASCAIPAVLPPFFDADGRMLVDGGVADNVPTRVMASLKSGPNLVVDVRPLTHRFFKVNYDAIPGRRTLLGRLASPWPGRASLPRCPGPVSVVQRSIFGNIRDEVAPEDPLQLSLRLPAFPGSSFMNWDCHAEVLDAAYEWTKRTIDELLTTDTLALSTMLAYSKAY